MKPKGETALVLGGGGPLGIAWQAGMLQGWAESWAQSSSHSLEGKDVFAPFLEGRIIGTSAGAIVGAHLAVHGSIAALAAQQHEPIGPDVPEKVSLAHFFLALLKAKLFTRSVPKLRRSIGKSALKAAIPGEQEMVAAIARSYAPAGPWPESTDLRITVVDPESGEFHGWHAGSGVPLALAVAASCAMPLVLPLIRVNGRLYMDGGIGSSTNATLASGYACVLVLDPLGRMLGNFSPLDVERRELEAGCSHTLAFLPDQAVADAIGNHVFDFSRRAQVATLARAQGHTTAPGVWSFLHDSVRRHGAEASI
jgi:NTE family protein